MRLTLSFISALLLTCILGCSSIETTSEDNRLNDPIYSNLSIATYNTFEDLDRTSPLIVEVKETGAIKKKTYELLDYTITEVKIKNVIKGDQSLTNKEINIVELDQLNMTDHDKVKNYVLFLYPHNGKIATNGYWIRGVYQGKFKLDENHRLYYDSDKYDGVKTFQDTISGLTVEEFSKKVFK